jgi:hypothetical protein
MFFFEELFKNVLKIHTRFFLFFIYLYGTSLILYIYCKWRQGWNSTPFVVVEIHYEWWRLISSLSFVDGGLLKNSNFELLKIMKLW